MSKEKPLQSMAIVIGPCWTNFCSQKLKSRILATFGFKCSGRRYMPKLHSMFCALFLKISLSATELMSFGHIGAAIWHRWTFICGVSSKISVTSTSQDNIREAIGEIPLHTIDNVLKNWTDYVVYCMVSRAAIWMKLFSIINRKDCTFKQKKKVENIFSSFF